MPSEELLDIQVVGEDSAARRMSEMQECTAVLDDMQILSGRSRT
jgi:hypothetical protein